MKRPAIIENRPCVYMIKNTVNGKVYVGSSLRPQSRFYEHVYQLKKGVHHSIRLQRSFDKYGEEAFVFIVLKYTDKNQHREEEARVLKILDTTNPKKGYNNSDLTELGVIRHSEETKEKMRRVAKGKKHTEEAREKMRKSKQAHAANMTDEERKIRSKSGKKFWEGLSKEEIIIHNKKSLNAAIKKTSKPVLCSNGMQFNSISDASRFFDVGSTVIRRLIKKQRPGGVSGCGKYSKLNGLSFKYAEETENVG